MRTKTLNLFDSACRPSALKSWWRSRRHRLQGVQPAIEFLEDRCLLASIVVTSLDDNMTADGDVTLREALQAANTNAAVDGSAAGEAAPVIDEIRFADGLTGKITLGGTQLEITETVNLIGPGNDVLSIDANQTSRVLNITEAAGDVVLSGLQFSRGRTTGDIVDANDTAPYGGGIRSVSPGRLRIENSVITDNQTRGLVFDVKPTLENPDKWKNAVPPPHERQDRWWLVDANTLRHEFDKEFLNGLRRLHAKGKLKLKFKGDWSYLQNTDAFAAFLAPLERVHRTSWRDIFWGDACPAWYTYRDRPG